MQAIPPSRDSSLNLKRNVTRDEVLNTAERLFAAHGWESVSVRDITSAAKVNLAAINYHFGSKHGLISAVLERRIVPINLERITALDEAELAADPHPVVLETLLNAFIQPAVRHARDPICGGSNLLKLIGRSFTQPGSDVEELLKKLCDNLFKRFDHAFQKALPDLTLDEIYWRVSFTHGAMHHWLLTMDNPALGRVIPGPLEEQIQRLIHFAAAGLRAPMPTHSK